MEKVFWCGFIYFLWFIIFKLKTLLKQLAYFSWTNLKNIAYATWLWRPRSSYSNKGILSPGEVHDGCHKALLGLRFCWMRHQRGSKRPDETWQCTDCSEGQRLACWTTWFHTTSRTRDWRLLEQSCGSNKDKSWIRNTNTVVRMRGAKEKWEQDVVGGPQREDVWVCWLRVHVG